MIKNAPLISESYTDGTGREVKLPDAVKKVISIAPNITEIVFGVGGESKLVARSQACNYPPEVGEYPELTTYPSIDPEELLALKGDLVIATDEIFGKDDVAEIERLGVPVYLQSYKTFDDIYKNIREMGTILDTEEQANYLADSLQNIEKAAKKATKDQIRFNAMILVSTDPMLVIGGKGYLNDMIELAGGKNLFGDKEQAYAPTTIEEIVKRNPEYLILPSKDQEIYVKLLESFPAFQKTTADLNTHVFIVDPDLYYRPGPRVVEGLAQLTRILHSAVNSEAFFDPQTK